MEDLTRGGSIKYLCVISLQVDQDEVSVDCYDPKELENAVDRKDYPPAICYAVRYEALPFPPPDFERPSLEQLTVSMTGTHKPVVFFPVAVYKGEYVCCIQYMYVSYLSN